MSSKLSYPIIDDISGDEIYTTSGAKFDPAIIDFTSPEIKALRVPGSISGRALNYPPPANGTNYSKTRNSIIAYIEANLRDPELNTSYLIRHFNISRSHLYRVFQENGGVAKLIRRKRLEHACRIMRGRKQRRIFLKEIAYLCGFRNGTQFNKAFKDHYGYPAKELQRDHENGRNNPPAPVQNQTMSAPERISLQAEPSE